MSSRIDVTLPVVQWNAVIAVLKPFKFVEAVEILKDLADQLKGNESKGYDEVTVKLTTAQVDHIIRVLEYVPYNVSARIIYALFTILQNNQKEEESPDKDSKESEGVPETMVSTTIQEDSNF